MVGWLHDNLDTFPWLFGHLAKFRHIPLSIWSFGKIFDTWQEVGHLSIACVTSKLYSTMAKLILVVTLLPH